VASAAHTRNAVGRLILAPPFVRCTRATSLTAERSDPFRKALSCRENRVTSMTRQEESPVDLYQKPADTSAGYPVGRPAPRLRPFGGRRSRPVRTENGGNHERSSGVRAPRSPPGLVGRGPVGQRQVVHDDLVAHPGSGTSGRAHGRRAPAGGNVGRSVAGFYGVWLQMSLTVFWTPGLCSAFDASASMSRTQFWPSIANV